jgi:hypothetical protein
VGGRDVRCVPEDGQGPNCAPLDWRAEAIGGPVGRRRARFTGDRWAAGLFGFEFGGEFVVGEGDDLLAFDDFWRTSFIAGRVWRGPLGVAATTRRLGLVRGRDHEPN